MPARRRYTFGEIDTIGNALKIVCYDPKQLADGLPELQPPPGRNDEYALARFPGLAQLLSGLFVEAEAVVGHAHHHAPGSRGCT
jgi:hypothetical protein